MRHSLSIPLLIFLLGIAAPQKACADIAVIAHRDIPINTLTPNKVFELYVGQTHSLDKEGKITVLIYELSDSKLRETFFLLLHGIKIKQINAYWARLQFSGEVLPPDRLPDSQAVLNTVSRNPGTIGYIDAALLNDSVKVLLRLKE